jgi:adenylylsulfate kinase
MTNLIKTIAVDFDGVLAEYTGWRGDDHYGQPLPGALDFIRLLFAQGYKVHIFTTRAGSYEGIERLEWWFKDHGLENDLVRRLVVTSIKSPAWLYVDDRVFLFRGTFPSIAEIEGFKSWWKTE